MSNLLSRDSVCDFFPAAVETTENPDLKKGERKKEQALSFTSQRAALTKEFLLHPVEVIL